MSKKYVGKRYVPKVMGEWNILTHYESLCIVTHEGASYTSKKDVPVGTDITNEFYWALTGNYNAQVEGYRQEVQGVSSQLADIPNQSYITEKAKAVDVNNVLMLKRDKAIKLNATLDFDDETKAQMTGVTPIIYSPIPTDKSIMPLHLSQNLADKIKIKTRWYDGSISADGTTSPYTNRKYSDYIDLSAGDSITLSDKTNFEFMVALYDSITLAFISRDAYLKNYTATGNYKARLTIVALNPTTYPVNENVVDMFLKNGGYVDNTGIVDKSVENKHLSDEAVKFNNFDDGVLEYYKNSLPIEWSNGRMNYTTGAYENLMNWFKSDYISVNTGDFVKIIGDDLTSFNVYLYDENKVYIKGVGVTGTYTFTQKCYVIIGITTTRNFRTEDVSKLSKQILIAIHGNDNIKKEKIIFMGDSKTRLKNYPLKIQNFGRGKYECYNVSFAGACITTVDTKYVPMSFLNLVNCFVSGDFSSVQNMDSTLIGTSHPSNQLSVDTLLTINLNDMDKLVFAYGTNDFNETLGTVEGTNTNEVLPALKIALETLITNFPHLKIYCILPPWVYGRDAGNTDGFFIADYINGFKEVASGLYNIPCYDIYHNGGINTLNKAYYMSDDLHQNELGDSMYAKKIMGFIENN